MTEATLKTLLEGITPPDALLALVMALRILTESKATSVPSRLMMLASMFSCSRSKDICFPDPF